MAVPPGGVTVKLPTLEHVAEEPNCRFTVSVSAQAVVVEMKFELLVPVAQPPVVAGATVASRTCAGVVG
jgi:hypothetical protein